MFAWLLAIVFFAAAAFASVRAIAPTLDQLAASSDFASYYCAGQVARERADPYTTQPLEQCREGASNPAPIPGYAIAFFSVLSFLPYNAAAFLWDLLLLFAVLVTVWATCRASGYPLIAVAAAVVGTDLVAGLTFGQISVVTACGVALIAYFLQMERRIEAALALILTLFQPLIGIPIAIALVCWVPQVRRQVAGVLAFAFLLSLAHIGIAETFEYFGRAWPVHAAAEVPLRFQYSLSWVAYFFGAGESFALGAGVVQYVLVAIAGIVLAPSVALRLRTPAVLAALPAAAAVVGGPSVHLSDLAVAVPFAAIVAASPDGTQTWGRVALVLLSAPWIALLSLGQAFVGGIAAAISTFFALAERQRLGVRAGAAAGVLLLTLLFPKVLGWLPNVAVRPPPMPQTFSARGYDPALAATQHGLAIRAQSNVTATSWEVFALKIPDWVALLLLLAAAWAIRAPARRSEPLPRIVAPPPEEFPPYSRS